MLTLHISHAQMQVLNNKGFHYPCPLVLKRLQAVYFKAKFAMSNETIGTFLGLHAYTVSRGWLPHGLHVDCYQQKGLAGLLQVGYGTNKSELETHQSSILTDFAQPPPVSINQAKDRIASLTGIQRSPGRIACFMKRHGLSFRKLGHMLAKADSEKQATWLKEAFEVYLQKAQSGKCHLLFMDAAHFVLAPFLCAVWSVVRMFIKAPTGRKRLNMVAALVAIRHKVSLLTNTSFVNAETVAYFLKQLRESYQDLPLFIILDNAPYQHCRFIEQLAIELNITLLFLSPYSPNLNSIERLWKFVKKKVLQILCGLLQVPTSYLYLFTRLQHDLQPQLKLLLTCKFQRFDNQTIYQI